MFRDIEMEDPAPTMFDDEETVQDSEGEGGHGEEVHGRDDLAVIAKESRPELASVVGRGQVPEIAGDGAFREVEAEFQKLTVNSGSAPAAVSGLTMTRTLLHAGQRRRSRTQNIRSWISRRGRGCFRLSTPSC